MDFSIYVDLIIERFHEAGGYSELDDKDLRKSLEIYMSDVYEKEVFKITKEMDDDKDDGLELDVNKYQEKFNDLEVKMLIKAKEMANSTEPYKALPLHSPYNS